MIKKDLRVKGAKALILGITFKENCPDVRNTRVIDIYNELSLFGLDVDVYDPWANASEVGHEFDISLLSEITSEQLNYYSAVVLAVAHQEFIKLSVSSSDHQVVYDVKGVLPKGRVDSRL